MTHIPRSLRRQIYFAFEITWCSGIERKTHRGVTMTFLYQHARVWQYGRVLILTVGNYAGTVTDVGRQRSSAVEQCFRKAKVAGSIPAAGSIFGSVFRHFALEAKAICTELSSHPSRNTRSRVTGVTTTLPDTLLTSTCASETQLCPTACRPPCVSASAKALSRVFAWQYPCYAKHVSYNTNLYLLDDFFK